MNNGKICVSICAGNAGEFIENIKLAAEIADVIELRFDCLKESEIESVLSQLKTLREKCGKPFLFTLRPKEQGGRRELDFLADRIGFWMDSRKIREADYVDIEYDIFCDEGHNWKLREADHAKYVCSYHNFERAYKKLNYIYEMLADARLKFTEKKRKADIIKIAVRAADITDTIPVWKLLERAQAENRQIIPIAMGESGKWTRILGLAHGASMSYAALDAGSETAPGQVSAKDLIEVYRAGELNENTDVYGIIGGNTSYSMSPYTHNSAFEFHDLNAVFVPLQVKNLDEFFRRMVKPETREIALNFKGFAVTIPHKQAIIKHLDYVDETAKKIGAVNTVKIENGKFFGFNTDAQGFIEPLKTTCGDLKNAKVAVFGAGGAARACVYALKKEGAQITIFARNIEKAKSLTDEFQVELKELSTLNSQLSTFDILINTTPLGTKGEMETETVAVAEQIKNARLVYDLVYNPLQTLFLREAESVNVPTIGGLAMLIAQAAAQQKIWTNLAAPLKEMRQAALYKLQ